MRLRNLGWAGLVGIAVLAGCSPRGDFTLNVADQTAAPGETKTVEVSVARTAPASGNTAPEEVSLSLQGANGAQLPAGISGTFSPNPVPGAGSASTLSLKLEGNVAPNTYTLQVRGTSTNLVRTKSFKLTVTGTTPPPPPPAGEFNIGLSAASVTVAQGASGNVTVTTQRNNFTAALTYTLEKSDGAALPAGITANFTGTGDTRTLSVGVGAAVAAGDYALRVKATGGSPAQTKTVALALKVTSTTPPPPPSIPIAKNTIKITGWSGTAGKLNASLSSNPGGIYYSADISASGDVSYTLPEPAASTHQSIPDLIAALSGGTINLSQCSSQIAATPNTTKGVYVFFQGKGGSNDGSVVIATKDVANPSLDTKQSFVVFLDNDVTLKTSQQCTVTSGPTYKISVDAALKKGWNAVVATVSQVEVTNSGTTITASVSGSPVNFPTGSAWRFYQKTP